MDADPVEYVCSSSSADSIADNIDDEDVAYTEDVIEAEGESELILIPRREVSVKRGLYFNRD